MLNPSLQPHFLILTIKSKVATKLNLVISHKIKHFFSLWSRCDRHTLRWHRKKSGRMQTLWEGKVGRTKGSRPVWKRDRHLAKSENTASKTGLAQTQAGGRRTGEREATQRTSSASFAISYGAQFLPSSLVFSPQV